jgi:hypothetical protein
MFVQTGEPQTECYLPHCHADITRVLSYTTNDALSVLWSVGFCTEHADALTGHDQPFGAFALDKPYAP